jgi:hypothetical protein
VRTSTAFRRLDPIDNAEVERVSCRPLFDELGRHIMEIPPQGNTAPNVEASSLRLHFTPRYRRPISVVAVAVAAIIVVVGLLVVGDGSSGSRAPITTQWRAARSFSVAPHGSTIHKKMGTWKLVDDRLSGTWQQNPTGPPPGSLTCPTTSICYVLSGHYASASGHSPLLYDSLYVSNDLGSTWSVLPMPHGFASTSPISCGSASVCAVGGTYDGYSVLAITHDAGHSFTIAPLPNGVGSLNRLTCPTTDYCAGLASHGLPGAAPSDATFLSTSNGGSSFTDSPILTGDSMLSLSCSSSLDCTVVGTSDAPGQIDLTAGVAARTTDGGHKWIAAALPTGFGISSFSSLSCADALHCSVLGLIAITIVNPPQCGSTPPGITSTTIPLAAQSPAVRTISQAETQAAAAGIAKETQSGTNVFSCRSGGEDLIGDIASTNDGGLSWAPEPLPADVPQPQFSDLSCTTDTQCWAAGSDAVPQQIGNAFDEGSSMLLGTTDGGATWSKVAFSVPSNAPNYDGQSYLSIGSIDCPSAGVCIANGSAAQSSPSAPFYSLVAPSSN